MRRPLDWIVVVISLMVLFANRMVTDSDPNSVASVPDFEALAERAGQPASPFAYIREDGTEVFLPDIGPRSAVDSRTPASTISAVYTWSLPMVTPAREPPSISTWPSSR